MRIIVCVKQILHTYARTGMDPSRDYIAPEDQVVRTNPYDEAAMEMAARLKQAEEGSQIAVVVLGPILSEKELRRSLAFGANDCIHVKYGGAPDPWTKSLVLSRVIGCLDGDLVLFGRESLDRGNAQLGTFCARQLKIPFLGPLLDAEIDRGRNRIRGVRKGKGGMRQVLECPMPAVIGMDLGGIDIRFPSYEDRVSAEQIPIQSLNCRWIEGEKRTEEKRIFPPRPRPKAVPTPDSRLPADQRMAFLLSGSRVEKRGEILEGTVEAMVDGVLAYLEKEGFV